MTSRDFCYWLQGYIEIGDVFPDQKQWLRIKNHLALVFKHEIDPSMGSAAHQQKLNEIHNKPDKIPGYDGPSYDEAGQPLFRC
jgi:hypothetical protein